MKKIIAFLFLLILSCPVYSQTDSVRYTKDFVFKDGIYITFQDFKNNNPPLISENFKKYNHDVDYFGEDLVGEHGLKERILNYPVNSDSIGKILCDSIFGYVIDGVPLILNELSTPKLIDLGIIPDSKNYKIKDLLVYRFFKFGKLCLIYPDKIKVKIYVDSLAANLAKSEDFFYSEYSNTYKNLEQSASTWSGSDPIMIGPQRLNKKTKLYMLSFDSGNIYKFKLDKFSFLLEKKDKELFNEFSKLPKGKQEDMMFIYLNKLNDRNPVYFKAGK